MSEEEIINWAKYLIKTREEHIKNQYWVGSNTFDCVEGLLDLYNKQKEEIKQLANGIKVLGTNPDITTEKIIKEFTEKPITEEYMEEFKNRYISKNKVLKALGYEEDDEDFTNMNEEKILSLLETLMSEVSRLEDIEDRKVQLEYLNIEKKRDKYWQDKIRDKIKEYKEHLNIINDKAPKRKNGKVNRVYNSYNRQWYENRIDILEELLEEK